jgi:hypothetical protein
MRSQLSYLLCLLSHISLRPNLNCSMNIHPLRSPYSVLARALSQSIKWKGSEVPRLPVDINHPSLIKLIIPLEEFLTKVECQIAAPSRLRKESVFSLVNFSPFPCCFPVKKLFIIMYVESSGSTAAPGESSTRIPSTSHLQGGKTRCFLVVYHHRNLAVQPSLIFPRSVLPAAYGRQNHHPQKTALPLC